MSAHGDAYRGSRARLTALANELGDDGLATIVPTCPDWRIHDVLGHLIGLVADVAAGNLDGIGSDAWTAKQVDDRRDRSGTELIAEWDAIGPGMEALLDDAPPRLGGQVVGDIVAHEHDVWGAVSRADARDTDAVALAFARYAEALGTRIAAAGIPALRLNDTVVGEGDAGATVTASTFELFRALTGRRSLEQIRAFAWDGDAEPYVALFSHYGTPTEAVLE